MSDDPRRYDFPEEDAFTRGEVWDIEISVREKQEDGTYDPAASFAAYSDWEFYVFPGLERSKTNEPIGPSQANRQRDALFYLTVGAGLTVGTPPEITLQASIAQSSLVPAGWRGYHLWAKVNSNWKRLAHGVLLVKD